MDRSGCWQTQLQLLVLVTFVTRLLLQWNTYKEINQRSHYKHVSAVMYLH